MSELRFSALQENMKAGLDLLSKSVNSKTLPVLNGVRIFSENGRIGMTTTDLEMSTTVYIGAAVEQDGGIVVGDYKKLQKLINALSPERIDVAMSQHTLKTEFVCGVTKTTLDGFDQSEFPELPEMDFEGAIKVDAEDFYKAVQEVFSSAAKNKANIMETIYLEETIGKLLFTAVDGFVLAHREVDIQGNNWDYAPPSRAIPVYAPSLKAAADLIKKNKSEEVYLKWGDKNHILIRSEDMEIVVQVVEGTFPDYRMVKPTESVSKVQADRDDLIRSLKRAKAVMNKESIRLQAVEQDRGVGILKVVMEEDGIKQESMVDALVTVDQENAVNIDYLLDALNSLDVDGPIQIEITLAKPFLIYQKDKPENYHVIMPMHIGR